MRNFASDNRVRTYQLEHRREFRPTSVSNLCYENYFYSDDPEVEESLAPLEGKWAKIIRKIIKHNSIQSLSEWEYYHLLIFLTYTHQRTKTKKLESNEFATDIMKLMLEMEPIEKGENAETREKALDALESGELRVQHDGVFARQELAGLLGYVLIADLQPVLLYDRTDRGFIFSDHPVILENSRFKKPDTEFVGGFQSQGLQIICPISSRLAIFLFDGEVYWPTGGGRRVSVGTDDVEEINKLQVIYALEGVYYRDSREAEMRVIHNEIEEYRTPIRHDFQELNADEHEFDTENEIVKFGKPLSDYSAEFQFLENLEVERKLKRSPELSQLHDEMMDDALADVDNKTI